MMYGKDKDPMGEALDKKKKGLKLAIMIGPDDEMMEEKEELMAEKKGDEDLEGEDELAMSDEDLVDEDIDMLPEKSQLGKRMKEMKKKKMMEEEETA